MSTPLNNNAQPNGLSDFIKNLRAALPYLEKFYNEIFVIKLSGFTLQQENLPSILDDLILLRRVGIKVILVHGAAPQITVLAREQGLSGDYSDGSLLIDEKLFHIALRAVAAANWELVTKLSNYGSDFLPVTGHFIQVSKTAQATGAVQDVNIAALIHATDQHYIPIIAPLGIDSRGRLYLVDPNEIALEVASRIRAHKLIILSSENSHLLADFAKRQQTTNDIKEWLKTHTGANIFTRQQIIALVSACERGVERCHLLDSDSEGALLGEILTSAGMGIMITNSFFQTVRPAKLGDVHMIAEILDKPMKDSTVVQKSFIYLEQHIENFLVFAIDEDVVGCCELVPYDENQSVEIGSLAVKATHRNRGIGKKLIHAAIEQAIKDSRKLIFALTTKAGFLFAGLGFHEMTPGQLPVQKRQNYDFSESVIYGKYLNK